MTVEATAESSSFDAAALLADARARISVLPGLQPADQDFVFDSISDAVEAILRAPPGDDADNTRRILPFRVETMVERIAARLFRERRNWCVRAREQVIALVPRLAPQPGKADSVSPGDRKLIDAVVAKDPGAADYPDVKLWAYANACGGILLRHGGGQPVVAPPPQRTGRTGAAGASKAAVGATAAAFDSIDLAQRIASYVQRAHDYTQLRRDQSPGGVAISREILAELRADLLDWTRTNTEPLDSVEATTLRNFEKIVEYRVLRAGFTQEDEDALRIYPGDWADVSAAALWIAEARRTNGAYTYTIFDFLAEDAVKTRKITAISDLLSPIDAAVALDGQLRIVPGSRYYGGDAAAKIEDLRAALGRMKFYGDPPKDPLGEEGVNPNDLAVIDDAVEYRIRAALHEQIMRLSDLLAPVDWPTIKANKRELLLANPATPIRLLIDFLDHLQKAKAGNGVYTPPGGTNNLPHFGKALNDYIAGKVLEDPRLKAIQYSESAARVRAEIVGIDLDIGMRTIRVEGSSGVQHTLPVDLFLGKARSIITRNLRLLGVTDEVAGAVALINSAPLAVPVPPENIASLIEGHTFGVKAPDVARKLRPSGTLDSKYLALTVSGWIRVSGSHPGLSSLPYPFTEANGYLNSATDSVLYVQTFWWMKEIPDYAFDVLRDVEVAPGVTTRPNPFYHEGVGPKVWALKDDPTLVGFKMDEAVQQTSERLERLFRDYIETQKAEDEVVAVLRAQRLSALPYQPSTAEIPTPRWVGDVAIPGQPTPGGVVKLDPHQMEAVHFADNVGGALVAFDVGVGKTWTAVKTVLAERQAGRARRPVVVVPRQLIAQWVANFKRVAPTLRVGVLGVAMPPPPTIPFVEGESPEDTAARREKAARAKYHKERHPLTGHRYTEPEIDAIRKREELDTPGKEERVAMWRAFRDGEFDVLLTTRENVAKTSIDPALLREIISSDRALQRHMQRETRKPRLRSQWMADTNRFSLGSGTIEAWQRMVIETVTRELIYGPPLRDRELIEFLLENQDEDVIPSEFADVCAQHGIVMQEIPRSNGDSVYVAVDPLTGDRFTKTRAKAIAESPRDQDPIWFGSKEDPSATDEFVRVPVDFVVLDEAHNYKGLFMAERRSYLNKGVIAYLGEGGVDAARAWSLYARCAVVRHHHPTNHGILSLTATPAKTSPLELFNTLQYSAKPELARLGMDDPERFISAYVRVEPTMKADPKKGDVERVRAATEVVASAIKPLLDASILYRTAVDVPRLAGSSRIPLEGGGFVDVSGRHGLAERDSDVFRVGPGDKVDFRLILPYIRNPDGTPRKGSYLFIPRGDVANNYFIEEVIEEGRALRVYPRFPNNSGNQSAGFSWQFRHSARVPVASPPRRISTVLRDHVRAVYDVVALAYSDALAHGRPMSGAMQANMLNLAMHPALADFGSTGGALYAETVPLANAAFLRGKVVASTSASGDEEEEEWDDSAVYADDNAPAADRAEQKSFVSMLERALRPDDLDTETNDKNRVVPVFFGGAKKALGQVDPADSAKLDRIADILVNSLLDGGEMVGEDVPCGHLVFVEGVAVHALLLVLLRRKIKAKRLSETKRLHAQGLSADEINRRLRRLTPSRVAVMNRPVTKGKVNRMQILVDGFNGAYTTKRNENGEDVIDEVVTAPLYDILIANSVANEGWDLQYRTCTIHMLDLPWEPGAFLQRMGRAVRQGNLRGDVEILIHLADDTLDHYRLQRVEGRRSWLATLLAGAATARLAETDEESQLQVILSAVIPSQKPVVEERLRRRFKAVREARVALARQEATDALQVLAATTAKALRLPDVRDVAVMPVDNHTKRQILGDVQGAKLSRTNAISLLREESMQPKIDMLPRGREVMAALLADTVALMPNAEGVEQGRVPIYDGMKVVYPDYHGSHVGVLRVFKGVVTAYAVLVPDAGGSSAFLIENTRDTEKGIKPYSPDVTKKWTWYALDESHPEWHTDLLDLFARVPSDDVRSTLRRRLDPPANVADIPGLFADALAPYILAGVKAYVRGLSQSTYRSSTHLTFDTGSDLVVFSNPTMTTEYGANEDARAAGDFNRLWLRWALDTGSAWALTPDPYQAHFAESLNAARAVQHDDYADRRAAWEQRNRLHNEYLDRVVAWEAEVKQVEAEHAAAVVALRTVVQMEVLTEATAGSGLLDPKVLAAEIETRVAARTPPLDLPKKPGTVRKPGVEPLPPVFPDPVWPASPPKPRLLLPTPKDRARFVELLSMVENPVGSSVYESGGTWLGLDYAAVWYEVKVALRKKIDAAGRALPVAPNTRPGLRLVDVAAWNAAVTAASTRIKSSEELAEEAEAAAAKAAAAKAAAEAADAGSAEPAIPALPVVWEKVDPTTYTFFARSADAENMVYRLRGDTKDRNAIHDKDGRWSFTVTFPARTGSYPVSIRALTAAGEVLAKWADEINPEED